MALSPEEKKMALATMPKPKGGLSKEEKAAALASIPKSNSYGYNPKDPLHSNPEQGVAFRSSARTGLMSALSDISDSVSSLNPLKNTVFGIPAEILKQKEKEKTPVLYDPAKLTEKERIAAENYPTTAKIANFGGYVAPSLTPIGLERQLALKAASLPKYAQLGAKAIGRGGEGAIVGAAYNPDDKLEGAVTGAGLGAASIAAEKAAPYTFNSIKAMGQIAQKYGAKGLKRLLGAHASADEMEKALTANRSIGASSSFGETARAPVIKTFESLSAHVPFSGNASAYTKRGEKIRDAVAETVDSMKPPTMVNDKKYDVNDSLQDALIKASKEAEKKKTQLYEEVNNYADNSKSKVNLDNYSKAAIENLETIEKFSKVNKEFSDIYDSSLVSSLKEIINPSDNESVILDKMGKPIKTPVDKKRSFGAAFDLDKRINFAIDKADSSSDFASASALKSLKRALNEDIDESALESGNKPLVKSWIDAKEHFKNNVIPLREKEITKFTKDEVNNEKIIPTFLKGGQFEQPQLLQQLTRYLTPDQKKYIAHEYLTKGLREVYGEEEIAEGNILNAYKNMGNDTKKILFTDAQRHKLDSALIAKAKSNLDLNQMINPKTGHTAAKIAGAGLATGGAFAYDQGYGYGALGMLAAPSVFGKISRSKSLQNQFLKVLRASERGIENHADMKKLEIGLKNASRAATVQQAKDHRDKNSQGY